MPIDCNVNMTSIMQQCEVVFGLIMSVLKSVNVQRIVMCEFSTPLKAMCNMCNMCA